MANYYVNKNKQPSGDNEVHRQGCSFMPDPENREYLGDYSSCFPAVAEAKRRGYNADGCYYCCNDCHTR
ncbi:MAG: hypothetical protein DHS20C02_15680 [Micavibrio sp.]|nr:MAG: hypothetical protein DHS20C02_15680 [Micavibrio sp.]